MKQTAVEWLHYKWSNCKEWKWEEIEQWFEQTKEMEKQQIIDAIERGFDEGCFFMDSGKTEIKNGEHYYNKTFNK